MRLQEENKEYIFKDDRPFKSCHASTLIFLEDQILVAWFGGTEEGAGDVDIWSSRRKEGRWSRPQKVADKTGIPHWNPVLFQDESKKIYLFYKIGPDISEWKTMIKTSTDNGYTWTEAEPLVKGDKGGRGPVKNKPIVLKDGTWLAPASLEKEEVWSAFVDISNDQGETWIKSEPVPLSNSNKEHSFRGKGVIQPTLWESTSGKVHMLMRSTAGYIYRSDSTDGGKTWGVAYSTGLPNNNSGIDLTRLRDGTLVLAYNPVSKNWGPRTPLILSISKDNGSTWEESYILEDEQGEYSYPALISQKNKIYLTYTWNRKRIVFQEIEFVS